MGIFIDTEIWSFAQKEPDKKKFKDGYEKALQMHTRSKEFLLENIDERILMSYHQISEIYHVLSFRGLKLPRAFSLEYVKSLLNAGNITKYEVTSEHYEAAAEASARSGIHIGDFLCVFPILEDVGVIYTCDRHFLDNEFKGIDAKIKNPIDRWINV